MVGNTYSSPQVPVVEVNIWSVGGVWIVGAVWSITSMMNEQDELFMLASVMESVTSVPATTSLPAIGCCTIGLNVQLSPTTASTV